MIALGAQVDRRTASCTFRVWAPLREQVDVHIVAPGERIAPMARDERGYWQTTMQGVGPGTRYFYRLDNDRDRPDPASRYQPEGVHGPSEVVDHQTFRWKDRTWKGLLLKKYVIYELHTGTFTPEGTFEAIIPRLADLKDLGVTAIELMPVSPFPGTRNWGYDGVYPFAVQHSYGGPDGLKRLVDACHGHGLAVILDVVYNHLGPEGNYLGEYGPYFTDRYRTPWGQAINFDGPNANEVRASVVGSALAWCRDYHIDALRLDAIHGIFDFSARHILQDIGAAVHAEGRTGKRRLHVMPESDLNNVRIISPLAQGGYGLDAQWNDDFHHALRTLLTGERRGYYEDFGRIADLVTAYRDGFVYSGRYSVHRKRDHGNRSADRPAEQFVVFSQNHDQVGNRMLGDRLITQVSWEALKLAAACVILSPYLPLLFMGEEYAEPAPFQYFVSHGDQGLIEAVRKGRKEEFRAFSWEGEPPDPQAEETFQRSRLSWELRGAGKHAAMLDWYRALFELRRRVSALASLSREHCSASGSEEERIVTVRRTTSRGSSEVFCAFNFSDEERSLTVRLSGMDARKLCDSADERWRGPGATAPERIGPRARITIRPQSAVVYAATKRKHA
ncbi:MAG: malto-oligosyltrehalose trehalohydrolase [Nitrospirota bacterium]|nr:malto-oligosyltrehalose trehalohydrolase [Nitrospirota bacterium]